MTISTTKSPLLRSDLSVEEMSAVVVAYCSSALLSFDPAYALVEVYAGRTRDEQASEKIKETFGNNLSDICAKLNWLDDYEVTIIKSLAYSFNKLPSTEKFTNNSFPTACDLHRWGFLPIDKDLIVQGCVLFEGVLISLEEEHEADTYTEHSWEMHNLTRNLVMDFLDSLSKCNLMKDTFVQCLPEKTWTLLERIASVELCKCFEVSRDPPFVRPMSILEIGRLIDRLRAPIFIQNVNIPRWGVKRYDDWRGIIHPQDNTELVFGFTKRLESKSLK